MQQDTEELVRRVTVCKDALTTMHEILPCYGYELLINRTCKLEKEVVLPKYNYLDKVRVILELADAIHVLNRSLEYFMSKYEGSYRN